MNVPFIQAEAQSNHLTETFLPFLHLLNRWSSQSTTMQPGTAWSGEQLSAGRLGSGFVRGEQSSTATREEWKEGGTPANKTQAEESELFAAVGRHKTCESTFIDDWSCMCREMQAANDRMTKRCFPSAAQRSSNPTGHLTQRLLLHAALLISDLTCH